MVADLTTDPHGRNMEPGGKITVIQTDAHGHRHKETFVCGADGGWKSARILVPGLDGVVAATSAQATP